ncbi:lysoplasmalogenase family protein [Nocardioides marmoraquaticus]
MGHPLAVTMTDAWLAGRPEPWARRARRVTKPTLVPLAARQLAARPDGPLIRHMRVALVAGWAGDVALLGEGRRPFLLGLGSFAAGHAACLAGLLRHRSHQPPVGPLPLAVLAVGTSLGPLLAHAAARREPGLGAPVAAYAALLIAAAAAATHLDDDLPSGARSRLAAGGVLFLMSDGVLGARTFVLDGPAPWAERAVMLTYAAAQWLLAAGAARC